MTVPGPGVILSFSRCVLILPSQWALDKNLCHRWLLVPHLELPTILTLHYYIWNSPERKLFQSAESVIFYKMHSLYLHKKKSWICIAFQCLYTYNKHRQKLKTGILPTTFGKYYMTKIPSGLNYMVIQGSRFLWYRCHYVCQTCTNKRCLKNTFRETVITKKLFIRNWWRNTVWFIKTPRIV